MGAATTAPGPILVVEGGNYVGGQNGEKSLQDELEGIRNASPDEYETDSTLLLASVISDPMALTHYLAEGFAPAHLAPSVRAIGSKIVEIVAGGILYRDDLLDRLQATHDSLSGLERARLLQVVRFVVSEGGDVAPSLAVADRLLRRYRRDTATAVRNRVAATARDATVDLEDFPDLLEHAASEIRAATAVDREEDIFDRLDCPTLEEIEDEPVDWLWERRFPKGALSLVYGDGGIGKSTFLTDIAALVSRGAALPGDSRPADGIGRRVLILASEDAGSTIRRRVHVAGGVLGNLRTLRGHRVRGSEPRPFSFPDDLRDFSALLAAYRPALVIIDPLTSVISGGIEPYNDTHVRRIVDPLNRLAQKWGFALVGNTHLNKKQQVSALDKMLGSVAWRNAARSILAVGKDSKCQGSIAIVGAKSNLSAPPAALTFRLVRREDSDVPVVEWDEKAPDGMTADSVLEPPKDRRVVSEAIDFLKAELADGERPSADVLSAARKIGIKGDAIKDARAVLGVVSRQQNRKWFMSLVSEPISVSEEARKDLQ